MEPSTTSTSQKERCIRDEFVKDVDVRTLYSYVNTALTSLFALVSLWRVLPRNAFMPQIIYAIHVSSNTWYHASQGLRGSIISREKKKILKRKVVFPVITGKAVRQRSHLYRESGQ